MVLDGKTIVEKHLIAFTNDLVDTERQIQPNGVDLRADRIYMATGSCYLPSDGKLKADLQISEVPLKNGVWNLSPRTGAALYYVDFLESASFKQGYCGRIITRSSLVRAGIDVATGLWDTGWNGILGATLRVWSPVTIQWGACLAQILFWESTFSGQMYEGQYQGLGSQIALLQAKG